MVLTKHYDYIFEERFQLCIPILLLLFLKSKPRYYVGLKKLVLIFIIFRYVIPNLDMFYVKKNGN